MNDREALSTTPSRLLRVAVSGTDPDAAISSLAGLYAGKEWYSSSSEGDYWFRYAGFGDEDVSFRRSQMSGYLRGDVAVEGEFVVQWIDKGGARVDVGRDEFRMAPGIPRLFPVERRFDMEYHDWDQRIVHMNRDLVMEVAGERWDMQRALPFDHTATPGPEAIATWRSAVGRASKVLQSAGSESLLWHEAKREVAQAFLAMYPPRVDSLPPVLLSAKNAKVRAMVEFLHQHAHEPITVGILAETVGLSVRAVQQAFQRTLDMSPMTYLQQIRLERVREALFASEPALTSVGEIARAWGFTHMGRFSGTYARQFGEYPSETLRRRR
ncbi:AraC family transcriptional regulator [Curtobacterium ammoniigenes]|uniref:AraC family transcriptional regulator n=1 Tax=Curtobacterium ammoniigenes TaxID=395387 RepID=UPI000A42410F|nr:helix-turn-helix domain-containing protein [Curtobacterium ammoniigenes]